MGDPRKIFVIHGRDEEVRDKVFDLLRALSLSPQEWEPLVATTGVALPFLYEVVSRGLSADEAQAVLALLTPDDVVALHSSLQVPDEAAEEILPSMQPRPNVLIELGMSLSLFRNRTIVLEFGHLRSIADLAGLNVIRFDGSGVALGKLVERLKLAGCEIDDRGSDWRKTSRFAELRAYTRRVR